MRAHVKRWFYTGQRNSLNAIETERRHAGASVTRCVYAEAKGLGPMCRPDTPRFAIAMPRRSGSKLLLPRWGAVAQSSGCRFIFRSYRPFIGRSSAFHACVTILCCRKSGLRSIFISHQKICFASFQDAAHAASVIACTSQCIHENRNHTFKGQVKSFTREPAEEGDNTQE